MAQLTYNSIRKFRFYGQEEESNREGETSREETLRDTLMRQILRKQLKTDLDIDECFNNRGKFTSGTRQKDFSLSARGILSNDCFKKVCNDFDVKEVLASCELDDNEINVLLQENDGRGKESDEAYSQKLQNIQLKLERRQESLENHSQESFSGAVQLNRHEFEEECRKTASDTAEKLTQCLVKLKPHSDSVHPDHPINRLTELEKELFPEEKNCPDVALPRKRKLEDTLKNSTCVVKYFKEKPESLWDMKERPVILSSKSANEHNLSECLNESSESAMKSETRLSSQDYSKPFVWSLDDSKLVPMTTINSNKLTIDQIRKEAKFSDYRPGIPSTTLYLKNLPHQLKPISIVSLFGHFEHENGVKIEYRILNRKMKGQAFVKFDSVETAIKAFALCNGYVLEGKPIVIEYGKTAN